MQMSSQSFGFDLTHQLSYVDVSNITAYTICKDFRKIYYGLVKAQDG